MKIKYKRQKKETLEYVVEGDASCLASPEVYYNMCMWEGGDV